MVTDWLGVRGHCGALLAACLLLTCSAAPIAPYIINHQNIVMTLHGLMDHMEVEKLEEQTTVKAASIAAFERFANETTDLHAVDLLALNQTEAEKIVEKMYHYMDTSGDGRLYLSELSGWLMAIVDHHYKTSEESARKEFILIGEGRPLRWQQLQWYRHHPYERGLTLFRDTDHDGNEKLEFSEFLQYRHPERCVAARQRFADRFILEHDLNKDGAINLTEFLFGSQKIVSPGDKEWSAQAFDFRSEQAELQREFREQIDLNHDNVLSKRELMELLDPRHISHVIAEVHALALAADDNGDHELSLEEVLKHMDLFRASKMIRFAQEIHADLDAMYASMAERLRSMAVRKKDEL